MGNSSNVIDNQDWANLSNWTDIDGNPATTLPGPNDDVTIESGNLHYNTSNIVPTVKTLILESPSSLIIDINCEKLISDYTYIQGDITITGNEQSILKNATINGAEITCSSSIMLIDSDLVGGSPPTNPSIGQIIPNDPSTIISNNVIFKGNSRNGGYIIGNAIFNDTSRNGSEGRITGNASFIGVNTTNEVGGEINGQQFYDPPVYGHFNLLRYSQDPGPWEARHLISYRDPNDQYVQRQQWYIYPQACPCLTYSADGCLNDIGSYSQFAPFTPPFTFVPENQLGWSENIDPCP